MRNVVLSVLLFFGIGCFGYGQNVVISNGAVRATFSLEYGAALVDLRYGDSENLINSIGDGGREYQAVIWEGDPTFLPPAGMSWATMWDMINPTQAGNYINGGSEVVDYVQTNNSLRATVIPLDYIPSNRRGPYRVANLRGRWPRTGWTVEVEYRVDVDGVNLKSTWYHNDNDPRLVQSIAHTAHLEPFFVGPFVNDEDRNLSSWCRESFNSDSVIIDSKIEGVRATFKSMGISQTVEGRTWNLDAPNNSSGPGCSPNVNPEDHESSDLVVLQVSRPFRQYIYKNTRITAESKLFLSPIKKEPRYIFPIMSSGYETTLYILSEYRNYCNVVFYNDGVPVFGKDVDMLRFVPLKIQTSTLSSYHPEIAVVTCNSKLEQALSLWYNTQNKNVSVVDAKKD